MIKKKILKSTSQRVMAMVLVVAILTTSMVTVAAASEQNTPKQEIVYINLNADGSVSKVYVVNTFELSEDGKVIDYGDYTSLRNMTSDEEIIFEDETVTIDTKAGKLYYEGFLSNNSIPWDFSIRYYLNDTEMSAEELAGKNGALKIKMSVRENTDCDSPFFENYALQASFTLDTKLCKNIATEGATIANVGRKKQITYTILPSRGADVEISADVTDFEMDGIAINGVPLSMNLDVKVENNEEINEATDGIAKLDDGASDMTSGAAELRDGASDLKDGAEELKDGAKTLNDGAADLKAGASDIKNGAKDLQSGSKELLDGSNAVKQGAKDLHTGISEIYSKIPQLITGSTAIDNGLGDVKTGASDLANGAKGIETGASELKNGADSLSVGLNALSSQNSEIIGGAYTVFASLTTQAEMQLNQSLLAMGMPTISLTPENYDVVLTGLLEALAGSTSSPELPPDIIESEIPVMPEEPLEPANPETPTEPVVPEAPSDEEEVIPDNDNSDLPTEQPSTEDIPADLPQEDTEQEQPTTDVIPEDPTKPVPEAPTDEEEVTPDNDNSDLSTEQPPTEDIPDDLPEEDTEQEQPTVNIETLLISNATPMAMNLNTYSVKRTVALATNSNAQGSGDSYQAILTIKAQLDEYNQFYLGLKEYTNAVGTAALGADSLKSGADALALGASSLRAGATSLYGGILVLKNGSAEMLTGLTQLQSGCGKLLDGVISLEDGTIQLHNGLLELSDGTIALLDGATTLYDGVIELCDGTLTLKDGCVEVLDGAIALYDGSVTLYDGTLELKDGTLEFRDKTADIDTTINDKITSAINDIMGTDFEPVSFVSEKNTNVEFVQFVVKTDAIEKTGTVTTAIPEEVPLTFWQKFLKLFSF